jgi:hypothetical protein
LLATNSAGSGSGSEAAPAQPGDPFPGLLAKVFPASSVAFLTLFSMAYNIVPMFAVSDQIGAEPTDYAG